MIRVYDPPLRPPPTYQNPPWTAAWDERYAPVPGWGVNLLLAGPPVIAMGAVQPGLLSPGVVASLRPTTPPSWWGAQSTGTKVAIGALAVAMVGAAVYVLRQ